MKIKTKRHICGAVSVFGLVMVYGAAGALECDTVSLSAGTLLMFVGISVFALAAYKGGYMN